MNRLNFWWRYVRRQTPWDTQIVPPEITRLADKLSPGRALDIGCGTGTSSLYLAGHGWKVTGIDFIPGAIRRARQKARVANLEVDFHVADATRLDFLHEPFELAIDIGCLHTLSVPQQERYAETLARLTVPGATFALYAFAPREINGRTVGLSPDDVAARFAPAFTVVESKQGRDKGEGPASGWYYLCRER